MHSYGKNHTHDSVGNLYNKKGEKEKTVSKAHMYSIIQKKLTEHRYKHTLGVVNSSVALANRFGADEEKAEVAAIFHDYAKFRSQKEMARLIQSVPEIPNDLIHYHKELWHSFVGAYLVQQEIPITDLEIVDAIRYHTTGRKHMSLLDKVVCLADYIEPGRTFPGVEDIRRMAEIDLNKALAAALHNTIRFLESKGEIVYPLTLEAYQELKRM